MAHPQVEWLAIVDGRAIFAVSVTLSNRHALGATASDFIVFMIFLRVEGRRKDANICNYAPFSFRFFDEFRGIIWVPFGSLLLLDPHLGSKIWAFFSSWPLVQTPSRTTLESLIVASQRDSIPLFLSIFKQIKHV